MVAGHWAGWEVGGGAGGGGGFVVLRHRIYLLGMTPDCADLHSLHFTRKPFTQLERRAVKPTAPINRPGAAGPFERTFLISHVGSVPYPHQVNPGFGGTV